MGEVGVDVVLEAGGEEEEEDADCRAEGRSPEDEVSGCQGVGLEGCCEVSTMRLKLDGMDSRIPSTQMATLLAA